MLADEDVDKYSSQRSTLKRKRLKSITVTLSQKLTAEYPPTSDDRVPRVYEENLKGNPD